MSYQPFLRRSHCALGPAAPADLTRRAVTLHVLSGLAAGYFGAGPCFGQLPAVGPARLRGLDATIKPALKAQAALIAEREHCSADPEWLHSVGAGVRQQVRVSRDGAGDALFTVSETRDESPDATVRMGKAGRRRLGADDGFAARVTATIPHPKLTDSEARRAGEFVERLDDDGRHTGLLILAPHGGEIEPHTDSQAERVARALAGKPVSAWRCRGYSVEGQLPAATRWHITSTDLSAASFPGLAKVAARVFDHAVSFHGMDGDGVLIGGAAPIGLKRELQSALQSALADTGLAVRIASTGQSLGGSDRRNVVNRYGRGTGLQVEQSAAARRLSWKPIADAVVAFYRTRI